MLMHFSKRLFDLFFSLLALLILSPILLLTALLVRIFLGTPILFKQQRPGYKGRPFAIYKFRSMRDAADRDGTPLPDSERLTRFGRILRSLSLDELPELFNILRGEMSVVGPRPALASQVELLALREAGGANACRPGLTGLAQINSYSNMPVQEKAEKESSQMTAKNSRFKRVNSAIVIGILVGILSLERKSSGKATKSGGR